MADQMVSHYRVLERLSLGTLGEVYKAEDTKLKRTVALKLLPAELSTDEQAKKRFLNEAKAAGSLDNPHIASVHEVGETPEGQLYIAMAYTPGKSLRAKLASGPLGVEGALKVATQVAEALQAAHAQGIVHRDISPQNILVSDEGDAKIVDFGLAKLAGVERLTKTGDVKGTVAYMSPEQASGKKVDTRTDIWSLGVVLAESLGGQGVPEELQRVVEKCLEKDPRDRYARASELVADLKSVGKGLETGTLKGRRPALRVKRSRLPLLVGSATGALLLIAATLVVVVWWKPWVAKVQERVTIALLPLENAGLPMGEEWYAEGVTDSLMTDLVKIHGLRVISQNSAKMFKPTDDIKEVGKKLGAAYIATGTVGKEADMVQLALRVVRTTDAREVWKREFEQSASQALGTQGEPARAISRAAGVKVSADESIRLAQGREVSPEAYDLYLKGKSLAATNDPAKAAQGISYLEKAVRLEPEWVTGWAELAGMASFNTQIVKDPELLRKAEDAQQKALALDPGNLQVNLMLGGIATWRNFEWNEGKSRCMAVLQSDPSNVDALDSLAAIYLYGFKQFPEATRYVEEMLRADPIKTGWAGIFYFYMRNYEKAVLLEEEAIRMDPSSSNWIRCLGNFYVEMKRYDEGITLIQKAVGMQAWQGDALLGYAYAKAGDRKRAEAIVENLVKDYKGLGSEAADIAMVYGALGRVDDAIRFLEKQYRLDKGNLWDLAVGQQWDPLRSDPRFITLLKKCNMPE